MFLFQQLLYKCDSLRDYWTKAEQFFTPSHLNTMTRDHYLHVLHYLHFTDNDKEVDKKDNHYDGLWKFREVFDILSVAYSKFYIPSECMVIDEVIVLFKGKVGFKQYIPKNHKHFGIKIYKLCDIYGYT